MDLTTAWASVEKGGWEVVWLGRRLGRPDPRRWLAQAIRYGPQPLRAQGWGNTAEEALTSLAGAVKPGRK